MLESMGIFFSAVCGFAAGAFLLVLFLKQLNEYDLKPTAHKKRNAIHTPNKEAEQENLLHKLPDKELSATDFNCAADGLEAGDYIAGHQKNKDNAYNTLKYRKQ